MALDIPALVSILIFYAVITIVGIWAAKVTRNRRSKNASDTMIIGGRDIGLLLGTCTLTATWVGGGALNGTAEATYNHSLGLIWCVGTFCYTLSMSIGGLFFLKKMREKNYITVLDPFEETLGKYFAAFYFLIESFGIIIYAAAILNALGGTIEVIAGLGRVTSILLSAGIATLYTLLGGIYSVAYTDVIQLSLMALGMLIVIPYAMTNVAVTSISDTFVTTNGSGWLGSLDSTEIGPYVDTALLTLLGGVPVQGSFQRLLSIDTIGHAQLVSVGATVCSALLIIPPALIGAIGASTDWSLTSYMNGTGVSPADLGNERQILPLVMYYLTPPAVGYIGLGVITAAVMSSADSAGLSFGGEFGRNFYRPILRPQSSEKEVLWAMRASILVFGAVAATIAIQTTSIMTLFILCSDLIFVLTWPQFVCSMYLDTNAYGTLVGIASGIIFRVGGGEYLLYIPSPFGYSGATPVKTIAMLSTFLSTVIISWIAKWLFKNGYIPAYCDILKSGLGVTPKEREAENENIKTEML